MAHIQTALEVISIRCALKNKRGASIIWVLCVMVVALIISGSILSASSMATGAAMRYRAAKHCYQYTKSLADVLTKDICGFTRNTSDPWYNIAQSVYDARIWAEDPTAEEPAAKVAPFEVTLHDVALSVGFPAAAADNAPVTTASITINNPMVNVLERYIPATFEEDGVTVDTPAKPETANVNFSMTIRLEAQYAGQTYVVYLKYGFSGSTKGDGDGLGQIDAGIYAFSGAYESP